MGIAWDVYSLANLDFYVSNSMLYFWRNWKLQLSINHQMLINPIFFTLNENALPRSYTQRVE